MIKRKVQVITQRYKGNLHRGVDLRCVDPLKKLQPCIAPEDAIILRNSNENGKDGYGNHYIVYRLDSGKILKSIHVQPEKGIKNGLSVIENQILGWPVTGGNSFSLHEHFEVWSEDGKESYDPTLYFIQNHIDYEFKAGA